MLEMNALGMPNGEAVVRRGVVTCLYLSLAWGCRGPTHEQAGPTPEDAQDLVEEYDQAIDRKDRQDLEALMSPRFAYFTSGGAVRTRAEFIGFLTSDAYRPEWRERSEIQVFPHGHVFVVSSRWKGRGTYAAVPFDDDQRCSLVVGQVGGRLKILTEHCTPVRE